MIVSGFAAIIEHEQLRPSRSADKDRLQKVRAAIGKARGEMASQIGQAGDRGVRSAGRMLAPMVTARWLREQFPRDGLTPARRHVFEMTYGVPRGPMPSRPEQRRATQLDIEEDSLHARVRFGEERAIDLLSAILAVIDDALGEALSLFPLLPGARGGRRALTQRQYLMANLASCWEGLGRRPTVGPNSDFTAFCEAIFEAIGWPIGGVEAAVPDALKLWRNHIGKNAR
jgi:hypothetical protein